MMMLIVLMMLMMILMMMIYIACSRPVTTIELMNAPPFVLQDHSFFRKYLQPNGCIAGDDSRFLVVLSHL